MGKRISVVAVLLATSFMGSLLALVLVGKNPLVGPTGVARTETLRPDVDGSPVSVQDASLAGSSSLTSTPPAASQVVGSQTAADRGPAEGRYRQGPVSADGAEDEAGPPPAPETAPPAEGDGVLAKTTSETSEPGGGNGKAKGNDKAKHGDDEIDNAVDDESSGDVSDSDDEPKEPKGPKDKEPKGPKGPKEPKEKSPRGGSDDAGSGASDGSKGSGKGKSAKGSGEGSSEPPGQVKEKGKP